MSGGEESSVVMSQHLGGSQTATIGVAGNPLSDLSHPSIMSQNALSNGRSGYIDQSVGHPASSTINYVMQPSAKSFTTSHPTYQA